MKVTIRRSIFETNSSSTHCLCYISDSSTKKPPKKLHLTYIYYGWEYEIITGIEAKANYLYSLCLSLDLEEEFKEVIKETLPETEITYGESYDNMGIDHSSDKSKLLEIMISRKKFKKFLLNNSFIVTGNDNNEYNYNNDYEVTEIARKKAKKTNYIIYYGGN